MENDELNLTMLGTGGGFGRCGDGHTNALLETAGETLLIDCSLYALDALDELGVDPLDVDGVVVTHVHGDHVSGLEELGFRHKFLGADGERPRLITHPTILPSRWGPTIRHDGTDLWENYLKGPMMHKADENGEAAACDLEEWFEPELADKVPLGAGDWHLHFLPVDHVPGKNSFGLLLTSEGDGPSVLYTADARPLDDEGMYEDVDVIFHDCHLAPKSEVGIQTIHTHLDELLELPESIQAKTHIMHYGEEVDAMEAVNGESLDAVYRGETFRFRASESGVDRE